MWFWFLSRVVGQNLGICFLLFFPFPSLSITKGPFSIYFFWFPWTCTESQSLILTSIPPAGSKITSFLEVRPVSLPRPRSGTMTQDYVLCDIWYGFLIKIWILCLHLLHPGIDWFLQIQIQTSLPWDYRLLGLCFSLMFMSHHMSRLGWSLE